MNTQDVAARASSSACPRALERGRQADPGASRDLAHLLRRLEDLAIETFLPMHERSAARLRELAAPGRLRGPGV